MKKKCFILALIAVCVSIAAYSTLAYFSYKDTATNVITAGDVKIELQELSVAGGEPHKFQNVMGVYPGTDVSKIVQVKNIGGQDVWVRIALDKKIDLGENTDITADASLVTYNINTDDWSFSDGYYYYNEMLKSGEVTTPLFTEVTFSPNMGNAYQKSKAIITVDAGATQVANNGETALEAGGWPTSEPSDTTDNNDKED